jgi:O-antigen/teichoic acid export membrane protein
MSDRLNPQQLVKNLLLLSLTTYLEYAVYVATSIVIARTLGPDKYAVYAFIIFLCGLLISLSSHGINLTVTNFTAAALGKSNRSLSRSIVSKLLRWQFVSIAVVILSAIAYLVFQPPKELELNLYWLLGLICGAVTFKALFLFLMSVGKGYGNFKVGNVASASASLISLIAIVYLGFHEGSVIAFLTVYLLACILAALLSLWLLREQVFGTPAGHPIDDSMNARLRTGTIQSAGAMILITFSIRSFETMALKSVDLTQVGYFAIAAMLSKGIADVIIGVCDRLLLPEFSRRLAQNGTVSLGEAFSATCKYYWFLGMLLCALGFCVAIPIVTTLYGVAFVPAGQALKWSLVATGFAALLSPSNAVQIALEDQINRIYLLFFSLVVSGVCSLLLVPRWGLDGAIASFGITILIMSSLSYSQTVRALKVTPQYLPMLKLTAAAGISIGITAVIWNQNKIWTAFVSMTLFCILFTILSVVLKCWSQKELQLAEVGLVKLKILKFESPFVEQVIRKFADS